MERRWWMNFAFLVVCVALSLAYIYPTLRNLDPKTSKYPIKDKMTLGLDLQGGLYLVMGVDFRKVFKDVIDRQLISLEEMAKEKNISLKAQKVLTHSDRADIPEDDPRVVLEFDASTRTALYDLIKKNYDTILRLTGDESQKMELGLSSNYRNQVRDRTIEQSKEVIRNRIDEFGVAEPTIAAQGNDRLVVELPGVKDIDRAKGLIGRTARLEMKIVDEESMRKLDVGAIVASVEKEKNIVYKEGEKFSDYLAAVNEAAKGKIPEGTEISFERKTNTRIPFLLKSKVEVTGDDLLDAQVQFDQQQGTPQVGFQLNPKGAQLFERVTKDHVGERLAILLDSTVFSAPNIRTTIAGGRGVIELGWGDNHDLMKEAKDLALVLRAGALPAQLESLEQRVVGPSLGADSVQKGTLAGMIGIAAVFLLISLYYRVSGLIAVMSLVLNVIFVVAILVGIEATLTLPGIAGIALTVGIAVDSNVVIYERVREELRAGKSLIGAVEAGFSKAFRTILDANVTNAAAAIVLLNFGSGPIKGFAVTMLVGIVTTMFTAIFVCKLAFDAYLKVIEGKPQAQISI